MPASDILNPSCEWDDEIQDSMTPNYGFTRKRTSTKLNKKAVGGTPWTRETQNTGHTFSFSWIGRSEACVRRLKRYYEQYEDGFFTIIDWDGGGRHYVGRFTSEIVPVETGNGIWDVQNATFEEIPQQAMLQYPHNWVEDGIWVYPYNDFGDQKTATSGSWTVSYPEVAPRPGESQNAALSSVGTNAGDWAQHEYRGYGCRLWMLKGPAFGIVQVHVDSVLQSTIDLYAAAAEGPQMVLDLTALPLDLHRVQVMVTNTKNAASSAPAATWWGLQVMR